MNVFELMAKIGLDSSEYEKGLSDSEDKFESFGSKVKGGIGTAAKVTAGAMATIATGTVALGTGLVKVTGDVAEYGDNIDKMSQKMGISAEAYQEWDAIMQHSGASIESLKPSMKTLATQAEQNAEEFQKLGISQEEVASLSQEDLFARVISGLQGMEAGTERTAIASKLLGKGATELGALLNTSAKDTEAMRKRVHELGGVMSNDAVKSAAAYQDQLQDMQTAMQGLTRDLASEFLPSITEVMSGITDLFTGDKESGLAKISSGIDNVISGITDKLPDIVEVGASILESIIMAISENLPKIFEAGSEIITKLATSLVENLPQIISTGIQSIYAMINGLQGALPELLNEGSMAIGYLIEAIKTYLPTFLQNGMSFIESMIQGIAENTPSIIGTIGEMLASLIGTIMDNLPDFLEKGVEIIGNMISGIGEALPDIISAIAGAVADILAEIGEHLPEYLQKGIELIGHILSGIVQAVPDLIAEIPKIIEDIKEEFTKVDWLEIGKNILLGIKDGFVNAGGELISGVTGTIGNAWDAITTWLGIASPSKKAKDEIGANWAKGIGKGFEENNPVAEMLTEVQNAFNDIMNTFNSFDWNSLGENIIKGISNGLENAAWQLADTAVRAVQNAWNSMTSWLGIHSPSKKAERELGKYWAEGIGIGFERNMPVDEMVNAVDDAFSKVGSLNPEITPAYSPEENSGRSYRTFAPVLNIYGADGQNTNELADAIMDRLTFLYNQEESAYGVA